MIISQPHHFNAGKRFVKNGRTDARRHCPLIRVARRMALKLKCENVSTTEYSKNLQNLIIYHTSDIKQTQQPFT